MLYGDRGHRQLQHSAPPLRPRSRVRRSTSLLRKLILSNNATEIDQNKLYDIVILHTMTMIKVM